VHTSAPITLRHQAKANLKTTEMELTEKYTKEALKYYNENERSAREAFPIVKNIYEDKTISLNVLLFVYRWCEIIKLVTDLKRAYETEGKQLIADFEKNITLSIVDEAWKNTHKMDELSNQFNLQYLRAKKRSINLQV
jgi:preprotein translocase subunit SecA